MIDREKIAKELAVRIQSDSEEWNTIELPIEQAKDILVLLKEQEPIEPEVFMDGIIERYKCRRCGKHLIKTRFWKDNYCSLCGSEILWK